MNIEKISVNGVLIGGAMIAIPATATWVIASSRAIFIELLANAILRILTANRVGIRFHGLSLIQVPTLWKVSRISATIGAGIAAFSILIALVHAAYQRIVLGKKEGFFKEFTHLYSL